MSDYTDVELARYAAQMAKPNAAKDDQIRSLRARLAAAEQQLTTATALLGECESWVVCEFHHGKDNSCMTCIASNAVLTRIREATKGTHP